MRRVALSAAVVLMAAAALSSCGSSLPQPWPAVAPDSLVDRYLDAAQQAFANADLAALRQVVLESSNPYAVDRYRITVLAAQREHRERHYVRVGHARLLNDGRSAYPNLEVTLRIDSDTAVGNGNAQTIFPSQTITLDLGFQRLTPEEVRLDNACRATAPPPSGTIPTPLPPQTTPDVAPGVAPMAGPCDMLAFPF
jgi:hypothetical protein